MDWPGTPLKATPQWPGTPVTKQAWPGTPVSAGPKPVAATGVTQGSPPEVTGKLEEDPSAQTYVDTSLSQLKRIPGETAEMATGGFKENTAEAFKAGQGNVAEGVAAMKRGDILKGATADVIGTIQEGGSPLTGAALTAWNMLGMGDPMLAGVEAPHMAANLGRAGEDLPAGTTASLGTAAKEDRARPTVDDLKAVSEPPKADNVVPIRPPTPSPSPSPSDAPKPVKENVLEFKPKEAGVSLREVSDVFNHDIIGLGHQEFEVNDGGKSVAHVIVHNQGDNVEVKWIGRNRSETENKDFANTLGLPMVRRIRDAIREQFPNAKTISGERISGARNNVKGVQAKVNLPTKPAGAAPAHPADILAGTIADRERNLAKQPGMVDNFKVAARTLRSISTPEKATPEGGRAAASIRASIGRSTRDSEKTRAALEGFQKQVSGYSPQEKLDIIDSMQNWSDRRAQGYEPIPEVKPLFDVIRKTFEERKAKLMAAPSTERMQFITDYYPQLWKDPEKARVFAGQFGTKEGSGGFTKARSIPTVADGIRAGLEPVTIDPIEATFRYVENVDRFLATNEVFDTAVEKGDVVWRAPGHQPDGWTQVQGRKNQPVTGQVPYAPDGWARVYNRFISRPLEGPAGQVLAGVQKVANSISAFKLGLSGFHAINMVGESIRSGIANSLDEAFYKNPIRAATALPKAYAKPVTSAIRGKQMLKSYLHDVGSPEMRKVVDLATEANFRVAGKGRIADEYRFTGAGSLLDAFKKGTLKAETLAGLKSAIGVHRPVTAIKSVATGVGRILETFSDPLFKTYIPAIKNGAFYDIVSTWLREHPEASHEEQVAFARQAADIVDNNFGEMNQDNIFWQRWTKQLAQSAFVSYSYTLGTARQINGTVSDLAAIPKKAVSGENIWSNNLSQAVALPIMVGTLGAVYQYAKTGKPPQDLRDLVAPRTGGVDASSGQPERASLPSYISQFLNGYNDLGGELTNKLNGLYELAKGALTGKDWRGDPIAPSTAGAGEVLKNYLEMAAGTWQPISTENRAKKGTGLTGVERFSGIRPAPMFMTNPEGYKAMKAAQAKRADKLKARHDATHERNYGGTQ